MLIGQQPESKTDDYIDVFVPNYANPKELFQVQISSPAKAQQSASIHLAEEEIKYSKSSFMLQPGERRYINARASASRDGLAWIHAYAAGFEDRWVAVNLGFLGHLKITSTAKLFYRVPSMMSLALVDKDDKPFSARSGLFLHLESGDADVRTSDGKLPVDLDLAAGVAVSPQFQVTPRARNGGTAHISATLSGYPNGPSYDTQVFSVNTEPASWLPITLAIGGGLLYGFYRLLNLSSKPEKNTAFDIFALLSTSAVAGLLGYLIANLDLLGLKIDPNILRSYPLLGFLVAYIGLDTVLKKKTGVADK